MTSSMTSLSLYIMLMAANERYASITDGFYPVRSESTGEKICRLSRVCPREKQQNVPDNLVYATFGVKGLGVGVHIPQVVRHLSMVCVVKTS